ncbi:unnamed protein product [Ambrosiozyma monospora]|uniref:RNA polymerase II subunit B1 CTD phosphatase RPAP2 homolog n=1 Tax=Ambrosiozyma monospora TaxID=43982 RepID=A0A9W7DNX0_AMBMO|nr:unnamed protein product [Ambrosiozyma monospora]
MDINNTTQPDSQTTTIQEILSILQPYQFKSTLIPKEASQLTYKLIEALMIHNCDKFTLRIISRYLSKQTYEDLVTERVINHYCGYPTCKYQNPNRIKEVQLNSLVSRLKLPRSYNTRFCCKAHYQCSEFYKKQLSFDALFARSGLNLPFDHEEAFETCVILLDDYFDTTTTGSNNNGNGGESADASTTTTMCRVDDVLSLLHEMRLEDPHMETEELINHFQTVNIIENKGLQKSSNVYGDTNGYSNSYPITHYH